MSSLFRDELAIFLGASRCALLRTGGGFRSRPVAEKVIPVPNPSFRNWEPVVELLREELESETWRKTKAKIILADNWLRYELLPWSVELSRESEQMQHARLLMSDIYGDVVDDWELGMSESLPGVSRVISAAPKALIEELHALAECGGIEVVSIQPRLIWSFNIWRHSIPKESAWFATVDDGVLAALHISNGRCDRVRSVRLSDNWVIELGRIKTMGRLARSRSIDGPMYVDAPARLRDGADSDNADVNWLSGSRDGRDALAQLGVIVEEAA